MKWPHNCIGPQERAKWGTYYGFIFPASLFDISIVGCSARGRSSGELFFFFALVLGLRSEILLHLKLQCTQVNPRLTARDFSLNLLRN